MKKQTHKNTTNELREVNNAISELLEELNSERARISAIQSEAEKALEAINKIQRTIAKLEVAIRSVSTSANKSKPYIAERDGALFIVEYVECCANGYVQSVQRHWYPLVKYQSAAHKSLVGKEVWYDGTNDVYKVISNSAAALELQLLHGKDTEATVFEECNGSEFIESQAKLYLFQRVKGE